MPGDHSTAGTAPPRLAVDGLRAGYGGAPVVADLSLHVGAGEVVCLLGVNGAGKTTTLSAISGLLRATAGSVRLDGELLRSRVPHRLVRQGLVHVSEDRSLFPSLTVREHLRLAVGGRRRPGRAAAEQAVGWFPTLGPILDRRVGPMSGGEQQMVAVARALVSGPRMVMIDELSLGLGPKVVASLLATMRSIASASGCGVLLVEQHVELALAVADRAYVLHRGRIVLEGPAADLAGDPQALLTGYLD